MGLGVAPCVIACIGVGGLLLFSWQRLMSRIATLDQQEADAEIKRFSLRSGYGLSILVGIPLLAILVEDLIEHGWTNELILPVISILLIVVLGGAWTSVWIRWQIRQYLRGYENL